MNRIEWLEEMTPFLSHPSMRGVQLDDVYSKPYDFDIDLRIPAVLVCLLTEVQFRIWNGNIVNKGLSLLLMRRGFEVGAFPAVWSTVSGVQEFVSREGRVSTHILSVLCALKEIEEETGIPIAMIEDEIFSIGNFLQPHPAKPEQCFVNEVICARLKPGLTRGIRLCHEHTGAIWVPVASIRDFMDKPQSLAQHCVLNQIIKDGIAFNVQADVFKMLLSQLDQE